MPCSASEFKRFKVQGSFNLDSFRSNEMENIRLKPIESLIYAPLCGNFFVLSLLYFGWIFIILSITMFEKIVLYFLTQYKEV